MDNQKIIELLEYLKAYVENDNIETISPVTHKKHEEWRSDKVCEILQAIEYVKEQA